MPFAYIQESRSLCLWILYFQSTLHGAADRALEAGRAMAGLLQSLASSIKHGTPALFPKGTK